MMHSFHSVCFLKMIYSLLLSSCFSPVHCPLQASWSDGFVSSVVRTQKEVKELLSQVWITAETHSPSLTIIISGFTTESSNSFPHLFQIRVLFLITKSVMHIHQSGFIRMLCFLLAVQKCSGLNVFSLFSHLVFFPKAVKSISR